MRINDNCIGCTACVEECPVMAIVADTGYKYMINEDRCIGCGQCKIICENGAIEE